MGGDGGTCASNRRYMRGAGSADHTADSYRATSSELAEAERDRLRQRMSTCAVSGARFDFSPKSVGGRDGCGKKGGGGTALIGRADLVSCPYGWLYVREAAVEALLMRGRRRGRKTDVADEGPPEIGWHVRGLKDLHPVRLHVTRIREGGAGAGASGGGGGGGGARGGKGEGNAGGVKYVPTCPITGVELTGTVAAYLLVRKPTTGREVRSRSRSDGKKGHDDGGNGRKEEEEDEDADDKERLDSQPNVLSERALREMGTEALQAEYGPFDEDDMIRLAPPIAGGVLDGIKAKLVRKREQEEEEKKKKKLSKKSKKSGEKKRKKGEHGGGRVDGDDNDNDYDCGVNKKNRPSPARPDLGGNVGVGIGVGASDAARVARSSVAVAVASNPVLSSIFSDGSRRRPGAEVGMGSISEKETKDGLFAR